MNNENTRIPIVDCNKKIPDYSYRSGVVFIPDIRPGENFVWVIHSPITPNVVPYRYLVSDFGRIFDRYYNRFLSSHFNNTDEGKGYLVTKIACYKSWNELYSKDVYIHRLVAFNFLWFQGCEFFDVNHKNGIKINNFAYNLEWVTKQENMAHASMMNLIPKGEDKFGVSIDNETAENICKLILAGFSNKQIAEMLNVSHKLVYSIKAGTHFKFISDKYNVKDYINHTNYTKLSDSDVHKICKLIVEGNSLQSIADKFDCKVQRIKDIKYGRNYKYISDNYNLQSVGRAKSDKMMDDELVREICRRITEGQSSASIERDLGLKRNTVYGIKSGKNYSNISSEFGIIPAENR